MNYMDCKALSEVAEVQTQYAVYLYALGFKSGGFDDQKNAITSACYNALKAWAVYESAADQYIKKIPVTWQKPGQARKAA